MGLEPQFSAGFVGMGVAIKDGGSTTHDLGCGDSNGLRLFRLSKLVRGRSKLGRDGGFRVLAGLEPSRLLGRRLVGGLGLPRHMKPDPPTKPFVLSNDSRVSEEWRGGRLIRNEFSTTGEFSKEDSNELSKQGNVEDLSNLPGFGFTVVG
mmetsp:Transcript_7830/g.17880  ORF Transcript_7830/g.17880 Transcript_7830/m.17880 type:complete len:150 (+) Transcript_7830:827-1276(+)